MDECKPRRFKESLRKSGFRGFGLWCMTGEDAHLKTGKAGSCGMLQLPPLFKVGSTVTMDTVSGRVTFSRVTFSRTFDFFADGLVGLCDSLSVVIYLHFKAYF